MASSSPLVDFWWPVGGPVGAAFSLRTSASPARDPKHRPDRLVALWNRRLAVAIGFKTGHWDAGVKDAL